MSGVFSPSPWSLYESTVNEPRNFDHVLGSLSRSWNSYSSLGGPNVEDARTLLPTCIPAWGVFAEACSWLGGFRWRQSPSNPWIACKVRRIRLALVILTTPRTRTHRQMNGNTPSWTRSNYQGTMHKSTAGNRMFGRDIPTMCRTYTVRQISCIRYRAKTSTWMPCRWSFNQRGWTPFSSNLTTRSCIYAQGLVDSAIQYYGQVYLCDPTYLFILASPACSARLLLTCYMRMRTVLHI